MATAVKEEKFELNLNVSGVSTTDPTPVAPSSGGIPMVFHEYPVPVGVSLVFTAEDIFALYFYSSSEAAEVNVKGTVDIVIADSSKQNTRSLLQVTRYGNLKVFDDADQVRHLDILPGDEIIVREGERILIRGESGFGGTIDGSESYFRLTCKRIRHTLFE